MSEGTLLRQVKSGWPALMGWVLAAYGESGLSTSTHFCLLAVAHCDQLPHLPAITMHCTLGTRSPNKPFLP